MNCEICKKDSAELNLIPRHQSDGKLDTMACRPCARTEGYLCSIHGDKIHQGFLDGSHACSDCIEKKVREHASQATTIADRLRATLPRHQASKLWGEALMVAQQSDCPVEIAILRYVVTRSHRLKESIEDIIANIIAAQSPDSILPHLAER